MAGGFWAKRSKKKKKRGFQGLGKEICPSPTPTRKDNFFARGPSLVRPALRRSREQKAAVPPFARPVFCQCPAAGNGKKLTPPPGFEPPTFQLRGGNLTTRLSATPARLGTLGLY